MNRIRLVKLLSNAILLSLMLSSCLTFSKPTDEQARNYIIHMPDATENRFYFWRKNNEEVLGNMLYSSTQNGVYHAGSYDYSTAHKTLYRECYDESGKPSDPEIIPIEKPFASLDEFSRYLLAKQYNAKVVIAENEFLPFVRQTFKDAETITCNGYRQGVAFYRTAGSWDLFLQDEAFKTKLEAYIVDGDWDAWRQKTLWVEAKEDHELKKIDPVFDIHIDPKENGAYEFRISLDWQHL